MCKILPYRTGIRRPTLVWDETEGAMKPIYKTGTLCLKTDFKPPQVAYPAPSGVMTGAGR
jgi:hypothetical protein